MVRLTHYSHCSDLKRWKLGKVHLSSLWYDICNYPNPAKLIFRLGFWILLTWFLNSLFHWARVRYIPGCFLAILHTFFTLCMTFTNNLAIKMDFWTRIFSSKIKFGITFWLWKFEFHFKHFLRHNIPRAFLILNEQNVEKINEQGSPLVQSV